MADLEYMCLQLKLKGPLKDRGTQKSLDALKNIAIETTEHKPVSVICSMLRMYMLVISIQQQQYCLPSIYTTPGVNFNLL